MATKHWKIGEFKWEIMYLLLPLLHLTESVSSKCLTYSTLHHYTLLTPCTMWKFLFQFFLRWEQIILTKNLLFVLRMFNVWYQFLKINFQIWTISKHPFEATTKYISLKLLRSILLLTYVQCTMHVRTAIKIQHMKWKHMFLLKWFLLLRN